MTSKTDLCILLFGDRKPKHVDHGEDARVYVEAIAEIKRLRAENEELRLALKHYTQCEIEECVGDDHDALPCVGHAAYEECASDRDRLRAEVEALKVIISQWYSVYTDDMPPDGDLLADTDAALRGEGE